GLGEMVDGGWAKWLTVSTIVIGSISYMGYLVTPDWREIVDSKHYYSNWKSPLYCTSRIQPGAPLMWNSCARSSEYKL
ncbi:hypothetical protein ANCDUO_11309, partial [Ancylostoma duodenale]